MFAARFFGSSYFGPRYFGKVGAAPEADGDHFGDRYFGTNYFGARYFGGTPGADVPPIERPDAQIVGGFTWRPSPMLADDLRSKRISNDDLLLLLAAQVAAGLVH
jgi:hypothetical protein